MRRTAVDEAAAKVGETASMHAMDAQGCKREQKIRSD